MTFPMRLPYRATLAFAGLLGGGAVVYCALMLAGAIDDPSVEPGTRRVEMIVGLVFGAWLVPFAATGLRHAKLRLGDDAIEYLGFGVLCRTRTIPFARIRRHGSCVRSAGQGRKERLLLLELDDLSQPSVRLDFYERSAEIPGALSARLTSAPTLLRATLTGAEFSE